MDLVKLVAGLAVVLIFASGLYKGLVNGVVEEGGGPWTTAAVGGIGVVLAIGGFIAAGVVIFFLGKAIFSKD